MNTRGVSRSKEREFLQQEMFKEELRKVSKKSINSPTLWRVSFEDFLKFQDDIKNQLGEKGFLMFTDKTVIFCFAKFPDLKIQLTGVESFKKKDATKFNFGPDFEIIGTAKEEIIGPIKQYLIDLQDNLLLISMITILYFCIFGTNKHNTAGIVSLSDILINIISIFAGIVFVFIGFIYSDREKAIEIFLRGNGDKYYSVNKYIMNLLMVILLMLVSISVIGRVTVEDLSNSVLKLQAQNDIIDVLISYEVQYYVCFLLGYVSICSTVICFRALVDYYLNDLRFSYFIDAVNKKSDDFK